MVRNDSVPVHHALLRQPVSTGSKSLCPSYMCTSRLTCAICALILRLACREIGINSVSGSRSSSSPLLLMGDRATSPVPSIERIARPLCRSSSGRREGLLALWPCWRFGLAWPGPLVEEISGLPSLIIGTASRKCNPALGLPSAALANIGLAARAGSHGNHADVSTAMSCFVSSVSVEPSWPDAAR